MIYFIQYHTYFAVLIMPSNSIHADIKNNEVYVALYDYIWAHTNELLGNTKFRDRLKTVRSGSCFYLFRDENNDDPPKKILYTGKGSCSLTQKVLCKRWPNNL